MLSHVLLLSAVISLTYGIPCGPLGRWCGLNAHCDTSLSPNKCVCDAGQEGCPLVECHVPADYQCTVKSDPHFVGFAQPRGNLNWPCRYRMTRIQHDLQGGVPGLAFCSFEVMGYNAVHNGKYYTSGVEISLGVVDAAHQFYRQEDFIKHSITSAGIATSANVATEWGTEVHDSWNGVNINCNYNAVQGLAIFTVPQCGFAVSFRAFNASGSGSGAQSHVPAISIITDGATMFGRTDLGNYPESLCATTRNQGDDQYVYLNRSIELGLKTPHQALLYDALNQSQVEQESFVSGYTNTVLQDSAMCNESVQTFALCDDFEKGASIKVCARLLPNMARCGAGIRALEAFNACLYAYCEDRNVGCDRLKDVYDATPTCARAPKVVKKLCGNLP